MLYHFRLEPIPTSGNVLRAMFVARRQVFVDLLKWDVPVIDGMFEMDQFDDEHADYLVLADAHDRHLGSARLLPTMRPHILGSFYPQLCDDLPPRGAEIFEITRFCLDRSLRARERRAVRDTLVVALADHAVANGIRAYTAIAEKAWLEQILRFGWRCRALGPTRLIEGRTLGALSIEIKRDTPRRLARSGIVASPALLDAGLAAAA